jgi:hypothetical protein
MRALASAAVGGVLLLGLLAGCSSGKEPSAGLQLRLAPGLGGDSTCSTTTTLVSSAGANVVRLTVLKPGDAGPEFVCDKVVPLTSQANQPSLYAPVAAGETVAIVAEAWKTDETGPDAGARQDAGGRDAADAGHDAAGVDAGEPPDAELEDAAGSDAAADAPRDAGGKLDGGTGTSTAKLLASGQIQGVDPRSATPHTIYLGESRGFSCTAAPAALGRAFHSATRLPDGRVALVGGLVADPNGATTINPSHLYATANVELYDPATQTFSTLVDGQPDARVPRAFHEAFLLDGGDPTRPSLLLLGGIAPKDGSELTPVVDMLQQVVLNLNPATQTKPAPVDVLELDLAAGTYTHSTPLTPEKAARFLEAATWVPPSKDGAHPGYFVVAGGAAASAGAQSLPTPVPTVELLDATGSAMSVAAVPLTQGGRIGATLTPVDATAPRWLLLGGNLWSDDTQPGNTRAETAAELLGASGSGAPTAITTTAVDLSTLAPTLDATAFHTATVLPEASGTVATLVMGGFLVEPSALAPGEMAAINPQAPGGATSPLRVFYAKVTPSVEEVPLPAGLKAVGQHQAVQLADGTVLITGGAPYNDGVGNATCPPENPLCHNACPFNTECPARSCPGGRVQQKATTSGPCAVCQAFRYWHDPAAAKRRVEAQGDLLVPRFGHRATLLGDGTVLVTGGITSHLANGCTGPDTVLAMVTSTEIYNPRGSASADDPLAALGIARQPAAEQPDPCCVCPSTIEETNKLARECTGPRTCVWKP